MARTDDARDLFHRMLVHVTQPDFSLFPKVIMKTSTQTDCTGAKSRCGKGGQLLVCVRGGNAKKQPPSPNSSRSWDPLASSSRSQDLSWCLVKVE
jgi:hypothetical protein